MINNTSFDLIAFTIGLHGNMLKNKILAHLDFILIIKHPHVMEVGQIKV